jgi:hypothetical protein
VQLNGHSGVEPSRQIDRQLDVQADLVHRPWTSAGREALSRRQPTQCTIACYERVMSSPARVPGAISTTGIESMILLAR